MKNPTTIKHQGRIAGNAAFFALLAAALYGMSAPLSKMLLDEIHPTLLAGLLYLGAGSGMLIWNTLRNLRTTKTKEAKLTRGDLPFVAGMILLDVAAPIFLMTGLTKTTAENASLLNNFEIVATCLLASLLFRESIGRRMWAAIILITCGSILLSLNHLGSLSFSPGSLLVLAACLCWGLENNCTRMLSLKNPLQIVVVKGFGAGSTAVLLFVLLGGVPQFNIMMVYALLLGFVSYGMSIYFYILSQRHLGAARTSAYYAAAPFIGVVLSWILLGETVDRSFAAALFLMLAGTYMAMTENHGHKHRHEPLSHTHVHNHRDEHHRHSESEEEHSHLHSHEPFSHSHEHTPDLHHVHSHDKRPGHSFGRKK